MLKMLEMKEQVQVCLSEKIQNQIKYLCSEISTVEWSGIIFYTVEGDISDPSSMKIIPQEILPLDKGTAGFTKYEFGLPVINFMHKHEATEKGWIVGHIHSHNSMAVFFSSTDDSELRDNSPNHRFYFSIIVNNKQEMCAKVATVAKTEITEVPNVGYSSLNKDGDTYEVLTQSHSIPEELLVIYNCDIQRDDFVTEDFMYLTKNIKSHVGSSLRQSSGTDWDKRGGIYSRDYTTDDSRSSTYKSHALEDDDDLYENRYKTSSDKDFVDSRKSQEKKNYFTSKTKATANSLRNFVPNLVMYSSEVDYSELEDALDDFIVAEIDPENSAKYISENFEEIMKDTFEDYSTFPRFCLRIIVNTLKSEADTYKKSKKAYFEILDPIHSVLKKKLEKLEKIEA